MHKQTAPSYQRCSQSLLAGLWATLYSCRPHHGLNRHCFWRGAQDHGCSLPPSIPHSPDVSCFDSERSSLWLKTKGCDGKAMTRMACRGPSISWDFVSWPLPVLPIIHLTGESRSIHSAHCLVSGPQLALTLREPCKGSVGWYVTKCASNKLSVLTFPLEEIQIECCLYELIKLWYLTSRLFQNKMGKTWKNSNCCLFQSGSMNRKVIVYLITFPNLYPTCRKQNMHHCF